MLKINVAFFYFNFFSIVTVFIPSSVLNLAEYTNPIKLIFCSCFLENKYVIKTSIHVELSNISEQQIYMNTNISWDCILDILLWID